MSKNLRDLRIEKGLTLTEAGRALGIAHGGVSAWELGKTTPRPSMVPKIAEFYGITPQEAREACEASAAEAKEAAEAPTK